VFRDFRQQQHNSYRWGRRKTRERGTKQHAIKSFNVVVVVVV
jgi:hypothetical protein